MEKHDYPDRMFIDVLGADESGMVTAVAHGRPVSGIHTSGRTPQRSKRLIVRDENTPVGSYRDDERVRLVCGDAIRILVPGKPDRVIEYDPGSRIELRF